MCIHFSLQYLFDPEATDLTLPAAKIAASLRSPSIGFVTGPNWPSQPIAACPKGHTEK
jgi:hypothetical protein